MSRRHRRNRLVALGVACFAATAVLWARLVQIQVFHHAAYAELARRQHDTLRRIDAVRGGLFDRAMNPLAVSAGLVSVGVRPARVRDRRRAEDALVRWAGVSRREARERLRRRRFAWVRRKIALSAEAAARLARIDGIDVRREPGRVYPAGMLAAGVVGLVDVDGRGVAGAEAAFDAVLRGRPGRERVVRNGRYRAARYQRRVLAPPVDGRDVVLTIDRDVQAICEGELDGALRRYGARWAAAIVMDVRTGDVVALAERPAARSRDGAQRADSLWTLRSVSHVYEPGSTFKLVTAAALLEFDRVAMADTFDAGHGRWRFPWGTLRDAHPHGTLRFDQAFTVSSNVVMARAIERLEPEAFHRVIRLFGFGERTGVGLLAEASGTVPPPDRWSGRTRNTLAFGQEVAVTPLQMLVAAAAVANDGRMMMPRIVRGIGRHGEIRWIDPIMVRRVVSPRTAARLRALCRRVVEEGTGRRARVEGLSVAGKTGTAQKALRGRYLRGRYVASFVGWAPADAPRLACIVGIDEPAVRYRYGGDSAAPVFARILRATATSTHWLDDGLGARTVTVHRDDRRRAPNFLRLDRDRALARARRLGVNVLVSGASGRVVGQVPPPGAPVGDDVIRLRVADATAGEGAPRPVGRARRRPGGSGPGAHRGGAASHRSSAGASVRGGTP